jgi:hypothetical protein
MLPRRMKLQLFFRLLILFSVSEGFFWTPRIYKNYSTNECVNTIMRKFTNPFPLIYMIDTNLQMFLPVVRQNSSQTNFTLFEYRKPDLYIIAERNNNLKFLLEFLGQFHIYNSRAKYIIFTTSTNYTLYFHHLSQHYIHGAVLLDLEGNVVTSKSFHYEDTNSTHVTTKIWEHCDIHNLDLADLFDKKIPLVWTNTTIATAYSQEFPYLVVQNNKIGGMFYEYIKQIKEKLQFEVTLIENPQEDFFNLTLGAFLVVFPKSIPKQIYL